MRLFDKLIFYGLLAYKMEIRKGFWHAQVVPTLVFIWGGYSGNEIHKALVLMVMGPYIKIMPCS
jgi:hypothetical protein